MFEPTALALTLRRFLSLVSAGLLAICVAPVALASIAGNDVNGDNAELFVIVWDPVREASYSLDLGVKINDFRIVAQQDAGLQQFWKIDAATDANFASLRALGTPVSSLRWAVLAFDAQNESFNDVGDVRAFWTLQQGPAEGALNQSYVNMNRVESNTFVSGIVSSSYAEWISRLNATPGHSPDGDLFNVAYNGSSFAVKGSTTYFGPEGGLADGPGLSTVFTANIVLTNLVGKSSWFYGVVNEQAAGDEPVIVDEFDNIAHDGYFGLALNPADGSLALSYTLEPATRTVAQREFAFGIGRSEINGGFSVRKLAYTDLGSTPQSANGFSRRFTHDIATPGFALPTTAVPEPQTWGLMLVGVLGLAVHARRRRVV